MSGASSPERAPAATAAVDGGPVSTPLNSRRDLPRWLYLWFPPLLLVPMFAVRSIDYLLYRRIFDGELGVIELATPVLAFTATGFGVALLLRARPPARWLRAWLLAVTAGAFYFGGEELSWGQHLFGWATPEYMERINDQEETNLHNVSSWFDQKPRLALELWVLIGGLILPLLWRGRRLEGWREWFWPSRVCLPTAAIAILVRLPERLKDVFGLETLPLEIRYAEPQEYYFALFLLLYLASLWRRSGPPAVAAGTP